MIPSLFISKPQEELSNSLLNFLESYCTSYVAHSFLRFQRVPCTVLLSADDAVFFGSPRAVEFFFAQNQLPVSCFVACVGKATEKALIQRGIRAHFVGVQSGDTRAVALDLQRQLPPSGQFHLIRSEQSVRSFAAVVPPQRLVEHVCYSTEIVPQTFATVFKVVVLTSPSNVHGFLAGNSASNALIVAWGKTCEKALNDHGIHPAVVLKTSSQEELRTTLFSKVLPLFRNI